MCTCRQRAYEQRRLSRPVRLLAADLAAIKATDKFSGDVVEVLRKIGLLPAAPRVKDVAPLHLVDPDEGSSG